MENFFKSQGERNLFWLYLLLIQPRVHLDFILKNQFCRWSLDSTFFMLNELSLYFSLGNYAALEGKIYCKPHLKQLFKLKGKSKQ